MMNSSISPPFIEVFFQNCANCALYQGKPADKAGGCSLFAGKQVAGPGWCSAWVKKA